MTSLEVVERLHSLAERLIAERSMERVADQFGGISCRYCGKRFRSARAVEEHQQLHERYRI